jgi:hypothetical protein
MTLGSRCARRSICGSAENNKYVERTAKLPRSIAAPHADPLGKSVIPVRPQLASFLLSQAFFPLL